MSKPVRADGSEVDLRRPQFLTGLDDTTYYHLYRALATNVNFSIPGPKALAFEIGTIGGMVRPLLHHVIFWADPTWSPGHNAELRFKSLNMANQLAAVYFPPRDDARDPVKEVRRQEKGRELAVTFINELKVDMRAGSFRLWAKQDAKVRGLKLNGCSVSC